MTRLSELWQTYETAKRQQDSCEQEQNDILSQKKTIPQESQNTLNKLKSITENPVRWFTWYYLLPIIPYIQIISFSEKKFNVTIIFLIFMVIWSFITYQIVLGKENRARKKALRQQIPLEKQINEINQHNNELDRKSQKCSEVIRNCRFEKDRIMKQVSDTTKSLDYFIKIFSDQNTNLIETEMISFGKFIVTNPKILQSSELFHIPYSNIHTQDTTLSNPVPTTPRWAEFARLSQRNWYANAFFFAIEWHYSKTLYAFCNSIHCPYHYQDLASYLSQRNVPQASTPIQTQFLSHIQCLKVVFSGNTHEEKSAIRLLTSRFHSEIRQKLSWNAPKPDPAAIPDPKWVAVKMADDRYRRDDDRYQDYRQSTEEILSLAPRGVTDRVYTALGGKTSYSIPSTHQGFPVTVIMEYAFESAPYIKLLVIPTSITLISEYIFPNSKQDIIHILYAGSSAQWQAIHLNKNWAKSNSNSIVIVNCTDQSIIY